MASNEVTPEIMNSAINIMKERIDEEINALKNRSFRLENFEAWFRSLDLSRRVNFASIHFISIVINVVVAFSEERVTDEMYDMRIRVETVERNNVARSRNARITSDDSYLHPLLDPEGRFVPNFPRTAADIDALDNGAARALLETLAHEIDPINQRQQLRVFVGLPAFPNV
ncbi:MAG: hypothetical protein M1828_006352 [Chrysothrix sp. TS-e1954]|nr:MAG: hypothetical protein M1828_006352 [Chrysothrix sp. TS-e1954]